MAAERPTSEQAPTRDVIWGRNIVLEALRAKRAIERIMIKKGVRSVGPIAQILQMAQEDGVRVEWVDEQRFQSIPGNHQGVMARVRPYRYSQIDDILALAERKEEIPFLLLVDSVQDPQNLGTLLRTAEVIGAHGVVLPEHRAVGVTPAVEKASAGAVEHLKIAQVTNLSRAIEQLKERGVWVIAVEADAPRDYDEQDYRMPLALVVGSEAKGISQLVRAKCDLAVRLPMRGHVGSLNVAIAGSIVLYHAWRQRSTSR